MVRQSGRRLPKPPAEPRPRRRGRYASAQRVQAGTVRNVRAAAAVPIVDIIDEDQLVTGERKQGK